MNHADTDRHLSRQGLILFSLMSLGLGINWPIMKIVLSEVPPLYFRAGCLLFSGLGLLLIARIGGNPIAVPKEQWFKLVVLSLFNIIGWNVLAIYGVLLLPSGRAALLGYTMPVWSAILSVFLLGESMTPRRVIGLILGLAGIIALMGGNLASFTAAPTGTLCMILAAWSWALGIVLFKRLPVGLSTVALTGWLMLIGSIPLLLAAIFLETPRLAWPSLWPAFGIVYNLFVAFMFCHWAWNRIVLTVPVAVSSLSSLIVPLIGVFSSVFFLGEKLGWQEILASLLILSAVATVSLKRPGS